jgi:alpha-ribazole phosphatase
VRLILVRHPKPRCETGVCYGRLDLECEPDALEDAARRLQGLVSGARVFTSPLRRARDLAGRLSASPLMDARLQELDFGDWEGRRWLDLGRTAVDAWLDSLPESAPPNGETLAAMAARCESWLQSMRTEDGPILAVTHAGPIRVIQAILKSQPLLTYFGAAIPYAEPIELTVATD